MFGNGWLRSACLLAVLQTSLAQPILAQPENTPSDEQPADRGLGIGGAALAFASKDAVSNVFGPVTVLTDRPFEIGDWIVTEGVEGTVENAGFRSTRIRTFYNSGPADIGDADAEGVGHAGDEGEQ